MGRGYQEEKKAIGENQYTETKEDTKRVGNSYPSKPTADKIAEQNKVNPIKPLKMLFSVCYLA